MLVPIGGNLEWFTVSALFEIQAKPEETRMTENNVTSEPLNIIIRYFKIFSFLFSLSSSYSVKYPPLERVWNDCGPKV